MPKSFEDLLWEYGIPSRWIVTREEFFRTDEFGEYVIPYVKGAWVGFKLGGVVETAN